MEIVEITIDNEVYVGMNTDYRGVINTTILEPNLYGKSEFIKRRFFHRYTMDGPERVSKESMIKILTDHKEK